MRNKLLTAEINSLLFERLGDLVALTKPRILLMVLLSTLIGFHLAVTGEYPLFLLLNVLLGTLLTGAGALTLNQWYEKDLDARMERTCHRPLPTGRLSEEVALQFGLILSFLGVIYLAVVVNVLTSVLGAITLLLYVLLYTPLKQRTILNTWIGAITGALPPMMGWAGASGKISWEILPLVGILYLWQMPHFFAICWLYKEEYRNAGFEMLSKKDQDGNRTAWHIVFHVVLLLIVSMSSYFIGQSGIWYIFFAVLCGVFFLVMAIGFCYQRSKENAKKLFLASILYLPILLLFLVFDQI